MKASTNFTQSVHSASSLDESGIVKTVLYKTQFEAIDSGSSIMLRNLSSASLNRNVACTSVVDTTTAIITSETSNARHDGYVDHTAVAVTMEISDERHDGCVHISDDVSSCELIGSYVICSDRTSTNNSSDAAADDYHIASLEHNLTEDEHTENNLWL